MEIPVGRDVSWAEKAECSLKNIDTDLWADNKITAQSNFTNVRSSQLHWQLHEWKHKIQDWQHSRRNIRVAPWKYMICISFGVKWLEMNIYPGFQGCNCMRETLWLVLYLDMLGSDTNPHWVGSRFFRCVWNTVGSISVVNHCCLHCAAGMK